MNETVNGVKWYREPWPWIIMAGPAVAVVAGLFTAFLAVSSDDGLVVGDYYKQGLAINQTLRRDEEARRIGITADIALLDGKGDSNLTLRLSGNHRFADRIVLKIVHPTQAGRDQAATMLRQPGGEYAGRLPPLMSGRWNVVVEDGEWRLTGVWDMGKEASAHLKATKDN